MKAKSLLFGFVAGTLVAGAAVLLSAPSSGRDLRDRIKINKDEAVDILAEIKARATELKDDTVYATKVSKETINQFLSEVKARIEYWKLEIEPHKNELSSQIQEIESAVGELEGIVGSSPTPKKMANKDPENQ
ncbi:YtxH domain-containing protein [Peribacillus saganii]|uniref:YtxH domain-containing protein n=1 Tax=Peribacillus saganii TaxID=2303992 RepID=A0A372LET6_9BACI|nr:YtxH domain-containing protein [Peribacillus saganii]RFU64401.1 YtxH domain-containing protein [Peribacillus saganii]